MLGPETTRRKSMKTLGLTCFAVVASVSALATNPESTVTTRGEGYTSYRTGAPDRQAAHQPLVLLVGGSSDRDDVMQDFVDKAGGGDLVVLRASGADGYNSWLLGLGASSVDSIVFTRRDA